MKVVIDIELPETGSTTDLEYQCPECGSRIFLVGVYELRCNRCNSTVGLIALPGSAILDNVITIDKHKHLVEEIKQLKSENARYANVEKRREQERIERPRRDYSCPCRKCEHLKNDIRIPSSKTGKMIKPGYPMCELAMKGPVLSQNRTPPWYPK